MNEGKEGVDALGLVLVGTNGGGTAYGFTRKAPVRWVSVPFTPMEATEVRVLGETVEGWLGEIATGEG